LTKIAVITDTHFGARGDSQIFLENQQRFFENVFFDKIDELDIKHILHLGDTFDRRKFVNYNVLEQTYSFYMDKIVDRNMEYHSIAGNHDVYYKNTNSTNSLDLLVSGKYPHFNLYTNEPKEIVIDGVKILMVPWVTSDNEENTLKMLRESNADIVAGHFEMKGFELHRGIVSQDGYEQKMFSQFEQVWSGHYHQSSKRDNIHYIGAPYEMDWSDCECWRGFSIFDTVDKSLTKIENPYKMFHKINYDDSDLRIEEIPELEFSNVKGAYIKIIIKNKTNPYMLDIFKDRLYQFNPADIKVIEDSLNLEGIADETLINEAKDTRQMLFDYVDGLETNIEQNKIKKFIEELYLEAVDI
jgi:DNA repair exonuclease SbcCD nuclease subunit